MSPIVEPAFVVHTIAVQMTIILDLLRVLLKRLRGKIVPADDPDKRDVDNLAVATGWRLDPDHHFTRKYYPEEPKTSEVSIAALCLYAKLSPRLSTRRKHWRKHARDVRSPPKATVTPSPKENIWYT